MNLSDILKTAHKSIIFITPNRIEKQLLFDRLCFHNAIFINSNLLKYGDIEINIFTADEISSNWSFVKNNVCYVEFPEALPEYVLAELQMNSSDYFLTNELI